MQKKKKVEIVNYNGRSFIIGLFESHLIESRPECDFL